MLNPFACQVAVNLIFLGAFLLFHRRTRRMQRLMNDHLNADYEHLQVTDELARRVANLDRKGLPEALRKEADDE